MTGASALPAGASNGSLDGLTKLLVVPARDWRIPVHTFGSGDPTRRRSALATTGLGQFHDRERPDRIPSPRARLAVLQRIGLAEPAGANTWHVRRDLEEVLRAMQRAADRQKTLAAHGVPISDDRLPIDVLDARTFTVVEGRILVHGQDENSGRGYLMLEGTDARVHFVQYTLEMEVLRADGGLRTNSFLRLRRRTGSGKAALTVRDLGDSEKVLNNRALLGENARALLKRGIVPTEDGWGGWLGRYQSALAHAAREISRDRDLQTRRSRQRGPERGR